LFITLIGKIMSVTFTVELTDAEVKAFECISYSIQDWIDNAAKERARIAMDEIYNIEVARMTADPSITSIPADKNQVVLDADVPTWKERSDAMENK